MTSSFRGKLEAIEASLVPRIRAFSESPEMLAIRWSLPWSFVGLGIGLPIFMLLRPSGSLLARFSAIRSRPAFGIMSGVLVVLLSPSFALAKRRNVPLAALAIAGAAGGRSRSRRPNPIRKFSPRRQALGTSGLFLGHGPRACWAVDSIALSAFPVRLSRRNLRGDAAAGPGHSRGCYACSRGISLTGELDMLDRAHGQSGRQPQRSCLIITFVETVLWTVGIHGPALLAAVVLPVYIQLQLQNTEAFDHHQPLPQSSRYPRSYSFFRGAPARRCLGTHALAQQEQAR